MGTFIILLLYSLTQCTVITYFPLSEGQEPCPSIAAQYLTPRLPCTAVQVVPWGSQQWPRSSLSFTCQALHPVQRKECLLLMCIKHHMGSWGLYLSHTKGSINVSILSLPSSLLHQPTPLLLESGQASSQSPDSSLFWSHEKQGSLKGHLSWEENFLWLLFYRDYGLRISLFKTKQSTLYPLKD